MNSSLGAYTWMESSDLGRNVYNFGGQLPGTCPCADGSNRCSDRRRACNCDSVRSEWQADEGNLTAKEDLGVMRVHFLRPRAMRQNAEARFLLGPLNCVDSRE